MERVFESRVSEMGLIYYIAISRALGSFFQSVYGERVVVPMEVVTEDE